MTDNVSQLYPGAMPEDRDKATGYVGSSLATIASLYVIAEFIDQAECSRFSAKRLRQAEKLLLDAKSRAWSLSRMFDLNMNDVIEIGQTESAQYLRWIGGEATFQHEWRHDGHREYRVTAVNKVDPSLAQVATDAAFELIIKGSM
jgi:hypothetical protein